MIAAELCAGGGGTALGLELAGFTADVLVERNGDCCNTLRENRPGWPVYQADITAGHLTGSYDLLSAGLPCTPHSRAGKQLGTDDERHLWHAALDIVAGAMPRAVMIETADAILSSLFDIERKATVSRLRSLGYFARWEVLDALWYGVSQHRKRAILVAFREAGPAAAFRWPAPSPKPPPTVGQLLYPRMSANGWPGAEAWRDKASTWAPTVVGGSDRHGGPDLGPAGSKQAWRRLGVDGNGVATDVPDETGRYERSEGKPGYVDGQGPMLTVRCGADLQGFPSGWTFSGGKSARWRQIGNAFPPPAAKAIGTAIRTALDERKTP